MEKESIPFEFVIIDDGSKDDSFEIAQQLERTYDNVFAYQLSKNYTSHYAIFAGLTKVQGGCCTIIPDDEQQPYSLIVKMYRMWQKGIKILIPHRIIRNDGFISKHFSNFFYTIFNRISDFKYPRGGADIFFIDREIIDILNTRVSPINTATTSEVLRLGFDPVYLGYERLKGKNKKSRWTLKNKIRLAKDLFISSSSFPLRLITYLGLFFLLLTIVFIGFIIYAKVFGNELFWELDKYRGYAALAVLISFFSGINLFCLGLLSEYILRIYEEVKGRPAFVIKNKNNSEKLNK